MDFYITAIVFIILLTSLIINKFPAHVLVFLALSTLTVSGVLTPEQAFGGFANKEMLTVAVLYIVAAGFQTGGLTSHLGKFIFGKKAAGRITVLRMMLLAGFISVFFNNTPIVAILAPVAVAWGQKHGMAPGKLLIPLSYAVIFGGMCSLIGTSTNLVVSGLMEKAQLGGMGFFEIGYVGIPVAFLGIGYMVTVGYALLPNSGRQTDQVLQQEDTEETCSEDKACVEARRRLLLPIGVLALVIVTVASGYLPMFQAALIAAALMILSGQVKGEEVLQNVEWNVLIVIGCAFGLATALEKTGIAAGLASGIVYVVQDGGSIAGLAAILAATCLVSEVLTNNAAAALMFPLAISTAQQFGVDPRPFAMAVAIGASAGYAIPMGYQTHLMVYNSGGYRLIDFLKIGIPLDILYIVASTLLFSLYMMH